MCLKGSWVIPAQLDSHDGTSLASLASGRLSAPLQWKYLHKIGISFWMWIYAFSVYWWALFYYPEPVWIDYIYYKGAAFWPGACVNAGTKADLLKKVCQTSTSLRGECYCSDGCDRGRCWYGLGKAYDRTSDRLAKLSPWNCISFGRSLRFIISGMRPGRSRSAKVRIGLPLICNASCIFIHGCLNDAPNSQSLCRTFKSPHCMPSCSLLKQSSWRVFGCVIAASRSHGFVICLLQQAQQHSVHFTEDVVSALPVTRDFRLRTIARVPSRIISVYAGYKGQRPEPELCCLGVSCSQPLPSCALPGNFSWHSRTQWQWACNAMVLSRRHESRTEQVAPHP